MGIITNLKDYFLNSSLHGLHFIADRRYHWIERLFWTICVLASWGASMVLILSAAEQYQSQKISFSVDTSYLSWKTNFPSIVVCESANPSVMDRENQNLFGIYTEFVTGLENFVFYDGTIKYTEQQYCGPDGSLRGTCLLGNYSMYMRKYRSTCSNVITSCQYNGAEFTCCDEFLPVETFQGPCYAFNSLPSGKYSTLEELPFKIDRHIEYAYGNLSIELLHTGFNVYAVSQDAVPIRDSQPVVKSIATNMSYQVFLSVKETLTEENARKMSIENRGCRFYDENNLKYSKVYSMSSCENECLVDAQVEICSCTGHTLPHNKQVKDCDYDGLLCTIWNKTEVVQLSRSCPCISSCFETQINRIGQTATKKWIRHGVAHIAFIVQPPTIRFARDVVKDELYILVSIGGTAGLFIGASFLTVVEVIYYMIVRPIGDQYLKWQRNKSVQKSKLKALYADDHYCFEYAN